MATAKQIYVDPSALSRLYFTQGGSREMVAWRMRHRNPMPVTHFGRTEMINAIALARFRGKLTAEEAVRSFDLLASDFSKGNLQQVDVLWRASLNKASEISRDFTPTLGTRALDVLHVACALEMGCASFLSFDEKQLALARAVGLRIAPVSF